MNTFFACHLFCTSTCLSLVSTNRQYTFKCYGTDIFLSLKKIFFLKNYSFCKVLICCIGPNSQQISWLASSLVRGSSKSSGAGSIQVTDTSHAQYCIFTLTASMPTFTKFTNMFCESLLSFELKMTFV